MQSQQKIAMTKILIMDGSMATLWCVQLLTVKMLASAILVPLSLFEAAVQLRIFKWVLCRGETGVHALIYLECIRESQHTVNGFRIKSVTIVTLDPRYAQIHHRHRQ